jgi:hypothetical protein
MKRKWQAVGIILLFIGVAVALGSNQSVVTASQDDDLVEVTTQACGIEPYAVKRGIVKIHFYEDLDNDSVFDTNEPSPPFLFIHLKNQYPSHSLMISRFKIIGGSGNVLFRFIPYPAVYNLTADYARNLYGCMTELWIYSDIINLNEDMVGTRIYLPIHHFIMPI